MERKRIAWMDGVRGLAMLWILIVHFITVFTPNRSVTFSGFLGFLLFGISGKLAVACFCVLLGYFASKPSRVGIVTYSIRRYLFFAVQILLVELLYYAAALILPAGLFLHRCVPFLLDGPQTLLPMIAGDAAFFTAQLLQTFWCVSSFVLAGIAVFCLERLLGGQSRWIRLMVCAVLFVVLVKVDQLWTALCLLGYALRLIQDIRLPGDPWVLILPVAILPWLIRRGECPTTYLMDGAACMIVLYVIGRLGWLQKPLSFRPLAVFGQHSMDLFLLHIPIYQILESLLELAGLSRPPYDIAYFALFLFVFALTTALAFGWHALMDRTLMKWLKRISLPF